VATTPVKKAEPVNMKLEVVLLSVSDVDRAKKFYENLGWRLDIDIAAGDFRGVQMTPHNSEASIIFGKGVTSATHGARIAWSLRWTTSTMPAPT
jgi:catechol 2,3-dioxygenase-like lactoylglutathione lyase family enzyme